MAETIAPILHSKFYKKDPVLGPYHINSVEDLENFLLLNPEYVNECRDINEKLRCKEMRCIYGDCGTKEKLKYYCHQMMAFCLLIHVGSVCDTSFKSAQFPMGERYVKHWNEVINNIAKALEEYNGYITMPTPPPLYPLKQHYLWYLKRLRFLYIEVDEHLGEVEEEVSKMFGIVNKSTRKGGGSVYVMFFNINH